MKQALHESVGSLYDLNEKCNAQLEERINDLVVFIENNKCDELSKWALRSYAVKIRDWMGFYNKWIGDALDAIEIEFNKNK